MASKVNGIIEQINVDNGNNVAIASTAYGYCETAANLAAKTVDMTGFILNDGVTIHIKFKYNNTAANPTLNVNGTGARAIVQYGTTASGNTSTSNGWYAGAVITLTYDKVDEDNGYWIRDLDSWRGIQDNLTSSTNTTQSLSAKLGYLLANGSARDNTKLPLAGGQMTGPLTWADSTALPLATSLSYFLGISAFADGGETKWITAANARASIGAAASSHTHGNITNDGKVGSDSNLLLMTSSNGLVTTASTIFINNTKIGINTNSEPSINFYVNGSSYLNGTTTVKTLNHYNSNGVQDGSWTMGARGVAPTATTTDGNTTYSGGAVGTSILTLGNNKAGGNNASGVNDNARGYLRIYNSGTTYSELTSYSTYVYPSTGLALPTNKLDILFRPDSGDYYTHISYQNNGNEALVFATQHISTSFIFVNGESTANISSSRWQSLDGSGNSGKGNAPGLQIKKNCVSIGKLIPSGTDPSYKLEVKGNTYFEGITKTNYTTASSTAKLSSAFLMMNTSGGNLAIEMYRGATNSTTNSYASWQFSIEGGVFHVRSDYKVVNGTNTQQTSYNNDILSINYATGVISVNSTTASSSTSSGAITIAGGLGVAGQVTATTFSGNLTGDVTGNADTATAIKTAGTTALFYRGDNAWSNTLSGSAGSGGIILLLESSATLASGQFTNGVAHRVANLVAGGNTVGISTGTASSDSNTAYFGFHKGSSAAENYALIGMYNHDSLIKVYNTGNTVIAGNLYPGTNNSKTLGTSTYRWKELYIQALSAGYNNGIIFISGTDTIEGRMNCDTNGTFCIYGRAKAVIRPQTNANTGLEVTSTAVYPTTAVTLGSSSKKWGTIYVGNLTIGGTVDTDPGKRITSSSTLYLNRASSTSLIFLLNTTSIMRIDTDNCFRPENATNSLTIGNTTYRWSNIYSKSGNFSNAVTISGDIIFPNASKLDWNGGTYRQRITLTDDSTANTTVFTFQLSSDSGSTYVDLFTIFDNKSVATSRYNYTVNDSIKAYTEYNSTDDSIDFIFA